MAITHDKPMFVPNVILAGAPKCGTTSVFDYLRGHPEICASNTKETYFLMDRGHPLRQPGGNIHDIGLDGYRQFFEHCEEGRFRLEATPDYLYQRTPLEEIPTWNEIPRIFFVLRRPEERVYSLYRFAQNNLANIPRAMSFAQFVHEIDADDGLFRGRPILKNAIENSEYSNYLLRWRSALGEENIRVFLFEELAASPHEFMKKVADFIGIDAEFFERMPLALKNKSFSVRAQPVHKMAKFLAQRLPRGAYRRLPARIYKKLNISQPSRLKTPEERQVLRELSERFITANDRLARDFDLDLTGWSQ